MEQRSQVTNTHQLFMQGWCKDEWTVKVEWFSLQPTLVSLNFTTVLVSRIEIMLANENEITSGLCGREIKIDFK